jgi:hypothetical protein
LCALHFSWSFFAVEMRTPVSEVLSLYWTIVTPEVLNQHGCTFMDVQVM